MADVSQLITFGIGPSGSVKFITTFGLGIGADVATIPDPDNVAYVTFRDRRAYASFRDRRAYVKYRDKRRLA